MVMPHSKETAAPAQNQALKTTGSGIAASTPAPQSQKTFKELDAQTTIDASFEPRWYQQAAVDAIFDYFYGGTKGNPLIVVPTGAGKSHILGMFCKRVMDAWPEQRILILTHVDTIIKQDYLAIRKHVPPAKVGIYSSSVGRKQRRAVTVAGIQSICKKASLFQGTNIILIDEAHTVPVRGEGQYRSFLAKIGVPIIGLTATHFRLGSGFLHEGKGRIFTHVACAIPIERLIEEGYLCELIPRAPLEHIDVEGVHTAGGDYVKKEIKERVGKEGLTESIVQELLQYKTHYRKWLVFATDIEHAEFIATCLRAAGVSAGVVHSKHSTKENEVERMRFSTGEYQSLVSVETLTTGFDEPEVDLIALLRPTQSPVLHIQMIGRGLRIHPGKQHCLVLDFAGNIARLGPINDVQVKKQRKKKGAPPITKTCPSCKAIHSGSVRVCSFCGHEFEFKVKIKDTASNQEIIAKKKKSKESIPETWYPVDKVGYSVYHGASNRVTLMVTYRCGLRTFFEHKLFSPGSRAGYHSEYWWQSRVQDPKTPTPQSSQEAVLLAQSGVLKIPTKILVDENGKYPSIRRTEYTK